MERRTFFTTIVSSVVGVIGINQIADNKETSEYHGGETVSPDNCECDCCLKIKDYRERIRNNNIPNTASERQTVKHLTDPKNHSWEGGCLYESIAEDANDSLGTDFSRADIQEAEYDISVTGTSSIINVNVSFRPSPSIGEIDSELRVGDVE